MIWPTDLLINCSNKRRLNSGQSPMAARGHPKQRHVCQRTTSDINNCIWRQFCVYIGSTVIHCHEIVPAFWRGARSNSLTKAQKYIQLRSADTNLSENNTRRLENFSIVLLSWLFWLFGLTSLVFSKWWVSAGKQRNALNTCIYIMKHLVIPFIWNY